MNYTVFDVETANNRRDSICSIGIIRYENNQIVYEKEIRINPEVEFNYFNTRIHGITAHDVAKAPIFPDVWMEIKQYFDQTILVAHNAKSMDLCALYRTLVRYKLPMIENDYLCTMELAMEIFRDAKEVESYKLDYLSKLYDIQLLHHHNALADTKACHEIFKRFTQEYSDKIKPRHYNFDYSYKDCDCSTTNGIDWIYSDKTKKMRSLHEIVLRIVEDDNITDFEIRELKAWLEQNTNLKGYYPFDKIFELVEDIMLDGKMNQGEEQELLNILDSFIIPKTVQIEVDFNGKNVCLSGEFQYGSKKDVEELLINRGAKIAKSVTGNLNILILGEAGSAAWKYGNYGSKYEKACQLNEQGKAILIMKENDIIGNKN